MDLIVQDLNNSYDKIPPITTAKKNAGTGQSFYLDF